MARIKAVHALVLAALAACGPGAGAPDAAPGAPTLAAIRSEIFNVSCGLSSCHAPPTLAAKLDLRDGGLCKLIVAHPSCLFPNKLIVTPGKPEASFLIDKLRGDNLTGTPDASCATTNARMPSGQPALPAAQIAQIEDWIRQGASCGDDVPIDAGVADAGIADMLADVATVTANPTTVKVGDRTQVTVTLTHGAPAAGQTIILDVADDTILTAPPSAHVDQGVSSAVFSVLAKTPSAATSVIASSGTNSMSASITVVAAAAASAPHARARPAR